MIWCGWMSYWMSFDDYMVFGMMQNWYIFWAEFVTFCTDHKWSFRYDINMISVRKLNLMSCLTFPSGLSRFHEVLTWFLNFTCSYVQSVFAEIKFSSGFWFFIFKLWGIGSSPFTGLIYSLCVTSVIFSRFFLSV